LGRIPTKATAEEVDKLPRAETNPSADADCDAKLKVEAVDPSAMRVGRPDIEEVDDVALILNVKIVPSAAGFSEDVATMQDTIFHERRKWQTQGDDRRGSPLAFD